MKNAEEMSKLRLAAAEPEIHQITQDIALIIEGRHSTATIMALVDVLAAIVFKTQSNPRARMQLVGYICGALSERIENA